MRALLSLMVGFGLLVGASTAAAVPAGVEDPSYGGGDGEVAVSIDNVRLEPVAIVASGGSAFVLARRKTDLEHRAVVLKFTSAGVLDPAFGGGDGSADLPVGFRALDVPDSYEPYAATRGRPLALSSGGIYVAGTDASDHSVVAKLMSNGTGLVAGWGTAGVATISTDASAAAAIAERPSGALVVAGTTATPGTFLAELTTAGVRSTGLDGDGLVERDPTAGANQLDRIIDLRLQPSGAAVVLRDVVDTNGAPDAGGAIKLERLTTAGALDGTFAAADLGAMPIRAARLVDQPGSGYVLTGASADFSTTQVRSKILDADGAGDATVRTATWSTTRVVPATGLPLADGSVALFGDQPSDGSRTMSARLKPDGTADPRWRPTGAIIPGLSSVGTGLGEGEVVDAAVDGSTALAVVRVPGVPTAPLKVVRVSLNEGPTASLTITPQSSDGPRTSVTFDASGTLDPDGPSEARTYRFDVDGDGTEELTTSSPVVVRDIDGPVTRTATVRASDVLGQTGTTAQAQYTVRDGSPAPTPSPTPVPTPVPTGAPTPTPAPPSGGLAPYTGGLVGSFLNPPGLQTATLNAPLVGATAAPNFFVAPPQRPVQVGGVELEPSLPRDGDKVVVRFKVDLKSDAPGSVCRIVLVPCLTSVNNGAITSQSGRVASIRAVVTAKSPQTTATFRVSAGSVSTDVPISFAVRPPQTVPDYDIVGVELTQGTQRETASARNAPPERDAPYDGVVLAGTEGEWGHPESLSGEVPSARIVVWVVAHGIRASTAPAPELYADLGRSQASKAGAVVRYGRPWLRGAPSTVPVTAETSLAPDLRANRAIPYVFHWVPDIHVPAISVRLAGDTVQCDDCSTANDRIVIRKPRVAVSRMRPTDVMRVYAQGSQNVVPDTSPLLQARTPGYLKCLIGPGGNATAESCEQLSDRLEDQTPRDGEGYRANDRFFTDGTGPMAGLAPFVLGATPKGQVIVPPGADAFTVGLATQLARGVGASARTTLALGAECVQTASGCGSGTAVSPPLLGVFGVPAPTAVVRDGSRYRLAGLAKGLHLAWGLAPASGRGGAVGAARWYPDEAGYLGGYGTQIMGAVGRDTVPVGNSAVNRANCPTDEVRDVTSACAGVASLDGANGTWISPRRWEALLIGARERAEVVNGNIVSDGALLPCPYRALNTLHYAPLVGNCTPPLSAFDPRPVDMSPFTPGSASAARAARAPAKRQQAEASVPALSVTLRATGTTVTGLMVARVPSTASSLTASATASSRIRVRGLDASGAVLADAAAAAAGADLGAEGPEAGGEVAVDAAATGLLPALAGIAQVQVLVDGQVAAQLDRGPAPTVAIGALAADGALSLQRTGTLFTRVEVSTDAGATWKAVVSGSGDAPLRILPADLPRSAKDAGRLRVTVLGAFEEAVAVSAPLTFAGPAVSVAITGDTEGTLKVRRGEDRTVTAAVTGEPAAPSTITWTAGGKKVATGPQLRLGDLPAGTHQLRVTVKDGATTVRSAARKVRIAASPPQLSEARVLGRRQGCGRVSVRLASDVAAAVRSGSRKLGSLPGNGARAQARTVRVTPPCGARKVTLKVVSPLGTKTVSLRLRR